jgi:hypothetical protein
VLADPADPDAVRTLSVTRGSSKSLLARSQTPGALSVRVDGVEVLTGEWWDYQQAETRSEPSATWKELFGLEPARGERVTVTVTPQRMTGDWSLLVSTTD